MIIYLFLIDVKCHSEILDFLKTCYPSNSEILTNYKILKKKTILFRLNAIECMHLSCNTLLTCKCHWWCIPPMHANQSFIQGYWSSAKYLFYIAMISLRSLNDRLFDRHMLSWQGPYVVLLSNSYASWGISSTARGI